MNRKRACFSTVSRRGKSFLHAYSGIWNCLKSEPNARLHGIATALIVIISIVLPVSNSEAVELCMAVGIVWIAELFNTCIEKMMDLFSLERNPAIGFIKDLAAGAVLVASLTAFGIAVLIFVPKLS